MEGDQPLRTRSLSVGVKVLVPPSFCWFRQNHFRRFVGWKFSPVSRQTHGERQVTGTLTKNTPTSSHLPRESRRGPFLAIGPPRTSYSGVVSSTYYYKVHKIIDQNILLNACLVVSYLLYHNVLLQLASYP